MSISLPLLCGVNQCIIELSELEGVLKDHCSTALKSPQEIELARKILVEREVSLED